MNLGDLVRRVDQLLSQGREVEATRYADSGRSYNIEYVKPAPMGAFRSVGLSFIQRVYGEKHPHYHEFRRATEDHYLSSLAAGIEILKAIRAEIEGGWLFSVRDLVTAEVFSDLLEMAEYLLDSDYKDPAAVIIGAVLEEQLRQLCQKKGITLEEERDGKSRPRSADRLNTELAKVEAYSKLDQKMITAWLDLRNKAAHGRFSEYTKKQVSNFLLGVTEFAARMAR